VVSFDHRDAGTAEEEWGSSDRWRDVPRLRLDSVSSAVVVAAHPDDETLGAGGLLSQLHASGVAITVLLATRGERSHATSLAARRETEFRASLDELAPRSSRIILPLPDGGLAEHGDKLRDRIAKAAASADLIVAPWRGDGHSDHDAAGLAAAKVAAQTGARLIEYPIWLWHWAGVTDHVVPWDRFVRLPLSEKERRAKGAAIARHASQMTSVGGEAPIIHRGMRRHFARAWEKFVAEPVTEGQA
jgi:LmbE family N-acetylglucosaminyl deacetylase